MYSNFLYVFILIIIHNVYCINNEYCSKEDIDGCNINSNFLKSRYILYDVNPPEGFNLRRDVYVRFAVFAHNLKNSDSTKLNNLKLVLPPWAHLYHWQSHDIQNQEQIPWGLFFDIDSMQKFAPVIEMYTFFEEIATSNSKVYIDEVYTLQQFKEMFETGKFEEKMSIEPCSKISKLTFYGFTNITTNNHRCLSFQGHTGMLSKVFENTKSRTVMFDHGEVALHDFYGDKRYWQARRSMRFNKELYKIAKNFRSAHLNSTDELDNTIQPEDWRDEKPHRDARGGPYVCAHLRRKDFIWGRPTEVPSIENAVKQIKNILKNQNVNNVFISTDAPNEEYLQIKKKFGAEVSVFKFQPSSEIKLKYKDGGIAIIDQIICSHAKYFIGTYESTFSFRIEEEREILGFTKESTFNRLCGDDNINSCSKPSVWQIVY